MADLSGVAMTPPANGVGSEWVQITYTLNGVSVSSRKVPDWTVVQPSSLQQLNLTDTAIVQQLSGSSQSTQGYSSLYTYQLCDQFQRALPNVSVNEDFGTWQSDYPNQNWVTPTANGGMPNNGVFTDELAQIVDVRFHNPPSLVPQSGTTKVLHAAHIWRAGSATPGKGTAVNIRTLQYYTDHGRNE